MSSRIFLWMLLCSISAAQAQRNISLGSSLTAQLTKNESWPSPSGEFAFGFQQVQKDGFLLAIWFNKIPQKTIVWSANRDNLVQRGSTVQLTKLGSLVLIDSTGKEIWSATAVSNGSKVDYAAMLDTGNFVLANQTRFNLWESFNHPTDTLLPTQILGQDTELVARYSESNYSSSKYNLKVANGDLTFYIRTLPKQPQELVYWTQPAPYGDIYQQSQNGIKLESLPPPNINSSTGFYQRAILEYDGVIRYYVYPKDDVDPNSRGFPSGEWSPTDTFLPRKICQTIPYNSGSGACGYNSYCSIGDFGRPICECLKGYEQIDSNDKMKGCKPSFEAQSCDEDSEDVNQFTILPMENTNWLVNEYEVIESKSEDWCKNACLVDCFCALAVYEENGNCVKKRYPLSSGVKDTMEDSDINEKTLFKYRNINSTASRPAKSMDSKQKDRTTEIVIGSVLVSSSAFLNILLLTTSLVLCFRLRHKTSITKTNQIMPEANLQNYTFAELEKATNGFKEQLGVGAFGVVCKGVVQSGNNITSAIAVKRLDKNNMVKEGDQEFEAEVMSIGCTNHKNLVQLIGFCNEGQRRLLVYEYMSNGSLATFLFGPSDKPKWHQRMQIALGIARGLFYLHEECSTQIIHCDIKPQNILLDDSYTARISDFGLAKILKTGQTQTMTGIRGTRGYVAPEWFRNTAVTAKVDVYSYGILLLELICCRKNVEEKVDDAEIILADWACDCYEAGKVEFLVGNDEEAMMEMKMVEKYVMVAIWCIQEDPSLRPTMKKVTQMLEGSVKVSTPPSPNSFISSL